MEQDLLRALDQLTDNESFHNLLYLLNIILPKYKNIIGKNPDLKSFFIISIYKNMNKLPDTVSGHLVQYLISMHKPWTRLTSELSCNDERVSVKLPGFQVTKSNYEKCFYKEFNMCNEPPMNGGMLYRNQIYLCFHCYKMYIMQSFERNAYQNEKNALFLPQCYFIVNLSDLICCQCVKEKEIHKYSNPGPFYFYYPKVFSPKKMHLLCTLCFYMLEFYKNLPVNCKNCNNGPVRNYNDSLHQQMVGGRQRSEASDRD